MRAKIRFHKGNPYSDEGIREVTDLVEIHYNYPGSSEPRIAFESKDTGFTIQTKYISEIEIFDN